MASLRTRISRVLLPVALLASSLLAACSSVPKGEGTYLINVTAADGGKPVSGVEIIATGDFRLFVNGTLSGGSTAAPIVFRFTDATVRGAWEGGAPEAEVDVDDALKGEALVVGLDGVVDE